MELKASFSVGNLRLLLLFEVTDWAITAQEGWRYVRMNLQIATGWKSVLWRRPPVVTLYFPPITPSLPLKHNLWAIGGIWLAGIIPFPLRISRGPRNSKRNGVLVWNNRTLMKMFKASFLSFSRPLFVFKGGKAVGLPRLSLKMFASLTEAAAEAGSYLWWYMWFTVCIWHPILGQICIFTIHA